MPIIVRKAPREAPQRHWCVLEVVRDPLTGVKSNEFRAAYAEADEEKAWRHAGDLVRSGRDAHIVECAHIDFRQE